MAQLSNKKKHQQFGFKLVMVALLVGLTFTVWYISDKAFKSSLPNPTPVSSGDKTSNLPADDLKELKEKYLQEATSFFTQGYDGVLLADNYKFHNLVPELEVEVDAEGDSNRDIWEEAYDKYGPIDKESIVYTVFGNQVKAYFEVVKDDVRTGFWMVLSFGNYDKAERLNLRPVLAEAALIKAVTPEEAALRKPTLWLGQKMERSPLKDYVLMDAVVQGKIGTVDLYEHENRKWKLIFFFPSAYTFVCPTECLGLLENFEEFQKLNIDIYAVSGDLANTLQAWNKTYFGGLPYTLVADPALTLAEQFGFAKFDEKVPYRGTVVVDPNGVIKFISAQSNDVGRSVDEFLRIITAMQTPGLKPENWQSGQPVIAP
jgi:alkyl hydroperoxide reductase subunit AhpC